MSALPPKVDKRECGRISRFVQEADIREMTCAKRETVSRRSLRNPIRCFDQAAAVAAAFRFLRHLPTPAAPARADPNSHKASRIGVALAPPPPVVVSPS